MWNEQMETGHASARLNCLQRENYPLCCISQMRHEWPEILGIFDRERPLPGVAFLEHELRSELIERSGKRRLNSKADCLIQLCIHSISSGTTPRAHGDSAALASRLPVVARGCLPQSAQ